MTPPPFETADEFDCYHKRVLYHLLRTTGEATTTELVDAYNELGELLYLGTTSTPLIDDNVFSYMAKLEADGKVARTKHSEPHTWRVVEERANHGTGCGREAGSS